MDEVESGDAVIVFLRSFYSELCAIRIGLIVWMWSWKFKLNHREEITTGYGMQLFIVWPNSPQFTVNGKI